jgi:glycosyltransferase involved in cell wall biosynthesis
MKLAVVTNILTPYRLPLFEYFSKSTKDCTVFLQAEREDNRQWRLPPVTFTRDVLPGFHIRRSDGEVPIHVNYGLFRRLRKLRPDVVLSGGFSAANVMAYVYCKLFGKRYVQWGEFTLHDGAEPSVVRRSIRQRLVKGADGCIASSQAARDAFLHYGAELGSILTASMPFEAESLHQRVSAWRDKLLTAPERDTYSGPALLSIGQLIARKGFDELFAMYREVIKARPEVILLIAGDGPCRKSYEALVRNENWTGVIFLGHVHEEELARYLALADLFIFPTRYDAYGLVLGEAMAAELPVLSSIHATATQDLVEEGVTGFRMEPADTIEAAKKILEVLAMSDEQRKRIGRAAYERVRSCDTTPTADRMIRFLRTLVYGVRANEEGFAQSFH